MRFCFVDESGDTSTLKSATDTSQPVLVIAGLFVEASHIPAITHSFLELKRRYFPGITGATSYAMDDMGVEIKGSYLRKEIRYGNRNRRRHALGYIDGLFNLLDHHHARLVARVWIKVIGVPFNGVPVYTATIQEICRHFQHHLDQSQDHGIVIADSRDYGNNIVVSHSIFTQQHGHGGNSYPRIAEAPLFGHSDNHAMLQITDAICSAVLFPAASFICCTGHVQNLHVHPGDQRIKERYKDRLYHSCYRYKNGQHWQGGITVSDPVGLKKASDFYN
jgi:hypothetical protein